MTVETDLLAGRYRRRASLGHGAMGEVWVADDLVLGRVVAIKQLRPNAHVGVNSDAVERMVREARVAARLHHPNIVAVFDLISENGLPHVVMEYVDGESLAERIRRVGRLPLAECANLIGQVATGLEMAHRADIVHRDIKPANIMVTRDGVAKLADFGIARGLDDASLTSSGQMIGTLAYMAPEVARTGNATAASDIWSLGATLYAAIEGRAPYDDGSKPSTTQMLIRLVTEPIPEPRQAGELRGLLLRMLDVDPATRPTAGEAQRSLVLARGSASPSGQSQPADEVPTPSRFNNGSSMNSSEVTRRRADLAGFRDEVDVPDFLKGRRFADEAAAATVMRSADQTPQHRAPADRRPDSTDDEQNGVIAAHGPIPPPDKSRRRRRTKIVVGIGGIAVALAIAASVTLIPGAASTSSTVTFYGVSLKNAADLTKPPDISSDATKAPPQLLVKDVATGAGVSAASNDRACVRFYLALYYDGTSVDSTGVKKECVWLSRADALIPGVEQGIWGNTNVAAMKKGGRRIIIVPASLGYGANPPPSTNIPPDAPLVFVIDLVNVGT